jgi:hypothetical protein
MILVSNSLFPIFKNLGARFVAQVVENSCGFRPQYCEIFWGVALC